MNLYATNPAHMVHFHGYSREYASQISDLTAEHQRLHEDDTAAHLDHTHESVVVTADQKGT